MVLSPLRTIAVFVLFPRLKIIKCVMQVHPSLKTQNQTTFDLTLCVSVRVCVCCVSTLGLFVDRLKSHWWRLSFVNGSQNEIKRMAIAVYCFYYLFSDSFLLNANYIVCPFFSLFCFHYLCHFTTQNHTHTLFQFIFCFVASQKCELCAKTDT